MPTTRYLMLKVAYHTLNEQPLGSVRSLGTDELEYCHGDKHRRETIEKLGMMNHK